MDTTSYLAWIALFLLSEVLVFAVQAPFRLRNSQVLSIILLVVKAFLVLFLAYELVSVTSGFWWKHDFFGAALYCALVGDCLASIVSSALRLMQIKRQKSERTSSAPENPLRNLRSAAITSFVLGTAVFVAGTLNMQTVICEPFELESSKLSTSHTVAFLADLHVGTAQQFSALEDTVSQINEAQPDFVILVGDISDENTSADSLRRGYEILDTIEAPTYFIYGNHDRQPDGNLVGGRSYTDDELVAVIEDNGITMLVDEYIVISDDLVLLGREDISAGEARQPGAAIASHNPNTSAFLLVADHQPYADEADAAAVHADLQISGHTHAGQLFPLQLVYNMAGLPAYGEYTLGGSRLLVSSGQAGWGFPLRTEARCTWNLITLTPAS